MSIKFFVITLMAVGLAQSVAQSHAQIAEESVKPAQICAELHLRSDGGTPVRTVCAAPHGSAMVAAAPTAAEQACKAGGDCDRAASTVRG